MSGDLVRIIPRAPEPTHQVQVHALTVTVLEALLALAKSGEVTNIVALSWHAGAPPQIHMSTEDKITALGALRTAEHCLVRDWLDGTVQR